MLTAFAENTKRLMFRKEVIAVYFGNATKHKYILWTKLRDFSVTLRPCSVDKLIRADSMKFRVVAGKIPTANSP
jgi:hypothetical protein